MSLSKMNYLYGVVELKYEIGKRLIVKTEWIANFKQKYDKTQDFFSFWSPDLHDNPETETCGYSKTFTGLPSLFKVFIVHLTNSIEEAQKYLEGRIKMVAKRFREPGDTEDEFKKIEAKKKKNFKKELKVQIANAHAKNTEYLFSEVSKIHASDQEKETLELQSDLPMMSMSTSTDVMNSPMHSSPFISLDDFVNDIIKDDSLYVGVSETDEERQTLVSDSVKTNKIQPVIQMSDLPSSSDLGACSSYDEYVQALMDQIGEAVHTENIHEELKDKEPELTPAPEMSIIVDGQNVVTINYDELIKENQELKRENETLKLKLENADKRNLVLQNYLVAADERLGQTLFIEKDGGRVYRGEVFLNKNQCAVLDKAKSDREFLNNLVTCIFGRTVLETSSITGAPSNRMKGKKTPDSASNATEDTPKVKLKLNPELLQLAYDIMDARSLTNNTPRLTKSAKNAIVGKKCTNAANAAEVYAAKNKIL